MSNKKISSQNTSTCGVDRHRNNAVTFRMTLEEKELFEKAFFASGFNAKQNYIIHSICQKDMASDRHIYLYFKMLILLEDIYRQLKGIGTNINQMSHRANATGILPSLTELDNTNSVLKEEVNSVWESIRYSLRELQRTQR